MSNRCYWVIWKDGTPHIEAGVIVVVGKTKKYSRAKMPSKEKLVNMSDVSLTIKEAIAKEIDDCAREYSSSFVYGRIKKARPWSVVGTVTKLWRLYRTMKRHNLV